jgi:hypothetical protein
LAVAVLCANAQGKPPVILIPGLTGSELIDGKTGATVWFKLRHTRENDLRLPISPNIAANRDDLKPGDIIRDVKPGILPRMDIYGGFITSLETRGGYKEGRWDAPPATIIRNSPFIAAICRGCCSMPSAPAPGTTGSLPTITAFL